MTEPLKPTTHNLDEIWISKDEWDFLKKQRELQHQEAFKSCSPIITKALNRLADEYNKTEEL